MDLYRIILPKDNDWEIMSELGQIGVSPDGNHSNFSSNNAQSQISGINPAHDFSRVSIREGTNHQSYQFSKDRLYTSGILQFIDLNSDSTV
jgi:hypothetical protein